MSPSITLAIRVTMQSSSSKLYISFFSHDVLFVLELMAIVVQEEGY